MTQALFIAFHYLQEALSPQIKGHICAAVSTVFLFATGITMRDVPVIMTCIGGLFTMGAAFMAIRYHYYATEEKKLSIKKLKSDNPS